MARTESSTAELGTLAPRFALTDVITGSSLSRDALATNPEDGGRRGLLVLFVCVHCPYVKHVEAELGRLGRDYFGQHGHGPLAIAAIQPNDISQYPEDGPAGMRAQAHRLGWTFPYLLDETQEVARSYGAVCTPDFFLFDKDLRLVYRGQFDGSRPRRAGLGNDEPVSGRDLRLAMDAVIEGRHPDPDQRSSLGCSIKWRDTLNGGQTP